MHASLILAAAGLVLLLSALWLRGRRGTVSRGRSSALLIAAGGAVLLAAVATAVVEQMRPGVPETWQAAWEARSTEALESWFQANTGPTVPVQTMVTGVVTVDSQQAADDLVGKTVVGRVVVTTSGVTLRDFKAVADGPGSSVVEVKGGLTDVVLEDFEVDGRDLLEVTAGVSGGTWANVTMRRAKIYRCLDGVRLFEGSTYEHLYVSDSTPHPEPYGGEERFHADAAQVVRGEQPILLRRSFLDHSVNGPNTTGVIMVLTDTAPIGGLTIEQNYLNGASYTITVEATEHGAPTDVVITDNRFGRDFTRGIWSGAGVAEGADYKRTGNVFADTYEPVPVTWGRL